MTTEARASTVKRITVSGIPVEVVRKDIENLHLGVYPVGTCAGCGTLGGER